MPRKLLVAIEIADSRLVHTLQEKLKEIPNLEIAQWFDSAAEKGSLAVKGLPDIILLDDTTDGTSIFNRLQLIRQNFPHAAVFVTSTNQFPQHIVEVMKAGVSEYLVTPINDKVLKNAVEDVRLKLASMGQVSRGSIYSFISSKGGLGSTVLAVNTACALAKHKESRIALFDMSIQSGDATVLLDLYPQTTMSDIVRNYHRLDSSFLLAAMTKHASGLEFMAAPNNPEDYDLIKTEHVSQVLDLARKIYDQVVVDCTSMSINDSNIEIFKMSEVVFLVTDMSVPAIRNCARLIKLLQKLGIDDNHIEVVVNRFIKGGSLSLSDVEKNLGKKVFWLFPNDFKGVVASINKGEPLMSGHSGTPLAKNVGQFVEKVKSPEGKHTFRGIRGAFGKAI
ncbi:Flp pilus polar localization response receiver ATPase TadZ, FlhG domain-containing [Syntrophotalea carbinolica DSM 2380]|uniref:Flp pilus polar localization response receiver ATPase TadZ, FlhG domain-containing n=1 Tax=Syntrophotalea carbinolica (strain DSM 2380 / NBRC 103641 / GraBd1) TaxID=338963 RepID=Q3A3R3_SYNC1|nr:AAA family ATPase [Syntrophotalea carbinolica]ABA88994.1 Flp pilus polar localization response receiver ATPase TadZ, FlhG domain-containing [Syntrophotalea carbinolica DSM 2380]